MTGEPTVVDLSDNLDLTNELLDRPWNWKQRLSERIELRASRHARIVSAYDVELGHGLVEPFLGGRTPAAVRVLLPLTTRPKGLLLRSEVAGPPWPGANRVAREDVAAIQADYLRWLVASSDAPAAFDAVHPGLFEAVCSFTPTLARRFEATARRWWERAPAAVAQRFERDFLPERTRVDALAAYLSDGLHLAVDAGTVRRLLDDAAAAGAVLARHLEDSAPDPFSSSENVLLALPWVDPPIGSLDEVGDVVRAYAAAVAAAEAAGATVLLEVLAQYGRSFEVLVEMVVPLAQPCRVELAEDRPQRLDRWNRTRQTVNFADAASYHLEIAAVDGAVDLGRVRLAAPGGRPIGLGTLDGVRLTDELVAAYSADGDRPNALDVEVRLLAPGRRIRHAVEALVVSAALAVTFAGPPERLLLPLLGLLALPATFAVTVLLAREQTPLAGRLHRWSRRRLAAVTVWLWAVVLVRALAL